jgi:capsular exopolysaccharide synthesis family protein
LGLPNRLGLSDLFVEAEDSLDGVMQKTEIPGLFALTSGDLPPNPSELLDSEKARQILGRIAELADVVLIDAPPTMAVTDAVTLAPHVAGVLLVIRAGKTSLAASRQAVEQLKQVGANLIGVVLTDVEAGRSRYDGYYHYYRYGEYGASPEPRKKRLFGAKRKRRRDKQQSGG